MAAAKGKASAEFHARRRAAQFRRTVSTVAGRNSFSAEDRTIGVLTSGGDSQGRRDDAPILRVV